MKLTKGDYMLILKHYGYKIPRTRNGNPNLTRMKTRVNNILAGKLCRCIKSVQKSKNRRYKRAAAIAICNNSIFRNRGLRHYRFTCKKKKKLYPRKGQHLIKTKRIRFRKRHKRK
tara:strand:+ start:922 stop:1266 length:345 start_codon:yes stop_codon:yes gene_type:complete